MFEVRWNFEARDQLATLWADAPDRNAITAAVGSLDRSLRTDPAEQGEAREADDRIVIVPPLVVDFRVFEGDRRVEVLAVRRIRRRSP